MNLRSLATLALATGLAAQGTAIFPAEYTDVADGPLNSPNYPLAFGTSRVMVVYDRQDMAVPVGSAITRLGFRQDAGTSTMDQGRGLQLEIRMGYTSNNPTSPSTTFDSNWVAAPTTVFGPALFTLPNLRDAANPLPNGQFFINLTTPFVYNPGQNHLVVEYRVLGNSIGGASFNYRLDRADFYSPVVLGPTGCMHSGGRIPTLDLTPVRTGSTLSATLTNGPANNLAILIANIGGRLATPFALDNLVPGIDPVCRGQLVGANLATVSAVLSTNGGTTWSYNLPNNPDLNNLWIAHQVACFDFFAPGGAVVSNGAEVQVGIRPRASVVAAQGPASTTTGSLNANYAPVSFFQYQ